MSPLEELRARDKLIAEARRANEQWLREQRQKAEQR